MVVLRTRARTNVRRMARIRVVGHPNRLRHPYRLAILTTLLSEQPMKRQSMTVLYAVVFLIQHLYYISIVLEDLGVTHMRACLIALNAIPVAFLQPREVEVVLGSLVVGAAITLLIWLVLLAVSWALPKRLSTLGILLLALISLVSLFGFISCLP